MHELSAHDRYRETCAHRNGVFRMNEAAYFGSLGTSAGAKSIDLKGTVNCLPATAKEGNGRDHNSASPQQSDASYAHVRGTLPSRG